MEEGLAVIDCGGVGFACHTTTSTLSKLKKGDSATLFTYCNIKEDAFDIYGFANNDELKSFQMLLGVSGVGPKVALSILSSTTPDRLSLAIMTGDEKTLTQVQGVGKKMAQRIILELKDKLGSLMAEADSGFEAVAAVTTGGKASEAAAALAALGYSTSEAGAALKGIDVDSLPVEEIIRSALKKMMK